MVPSVGARSPGKENGVLRGAGGGGETLAGKEQARNPQGRENRRPRPQASARTQEQKLREMREHTGTWKR